MELTTEVFKTANGDVEGAILKWTGFGILLVAGTKGFIACPAFDAIACDGYGTAVAIVESSPDNPIGTLERFCDRKITQVSDNGIALGIKKGMLAKDAFELIA